MCVPRSIRLRESYLRQQIQIQKLRERIKELEAMTSLISKKERQEFHKEFQKQHTKRDVTEGDTTVSLFSFIFFNVLVRSDPCPLFRAGKALRLRHCRLWEPILHV